MSAKAEKRLSLEHKSLSLESLCHQKLRGSKPGPFASFGEQGTTEVLTVPPLKNKPDCVTQPDLELDNLPASASRVLKLQASTDIPGIL